MCFMGGHALWVEGERSRALQRPRKDMKAMLYRDSRPLHQGMGCNQQFRAKNPDAQHPPVWSITYMTGLASTSITKTLKDPNTARPR